MSRQTKKPAPSFDPYGPQAVECELFIVVEIDANGNAFIAEASHSEELIDDTFDDRPKSYEERHVVKASVEFSFTRPQLLVLSPAVEPERLRIAKASA